ncbi:hypothetical protein F5Y11DRAFT_323848 [Daldinia sp. FL1419]|nr:hypothetical protein F5Y11DRAFT_323848 [Daldinia sp. FL1419]
MQPQPQPQPWQEATTQSQYVHRQTDPQPCQDNPMDDLRDAKNSVALFADYISRLEPDNSRPHSSGDFSSFSPPTVTRQGSTTSTDGSRKGSSRRHYRAVGKEWAESPQGTVWTHISNTLREVAAEFPGVNPTAIQEFISTRDILEMGAEFVRYYRQAGHAMEKPYWVAEDLFFDLQSVKQGDTVPERWTRARSERKREWDLADHLVRFVLLADIVRIRANRQDWNTWSNGFVRKVSFYLCILRCFTVRDAEQRQAAREAVREASPREASPREAPRDRNSKLLTKRSSYTSSSSKLSHQSK